MFKIQNEYPSPSPLWEREELLFSPPFPLGRRRKRGDGKIKTFLPSPSLILSFLPREEDNNNQTVTKLVSNYRLSILTILLNFLIFLKKFIKFEHFSSAQIHFAYNPYEKYEIGINL